MINPISPTYVHIYETALEFARRLVLAAFQNKNRRVYTGRYEAKYILVNLMFESTCHSQRVVHIFFAEVLGEIVEIWGVDSAKF